MSRFADQFTDDDLREILIISEYLNIKWGDALGLLVGWRGYQSTPRQMLDDWVLTERLQKIDRQKIKDP